MRRFDWFDWTDWLITVLVMAVLIGIGIGIAEFAAGLKPAATPAPWDIIVDIPGQGLNTFTTPATPHWDGPCIRAGDVVLCHVVMIRPHVDVPAAPSPAATPAPKGEKK